MSLASVKPGDIVQVNKRGRKFHAIVLERTARELRVQPIDSRINYYTATAREVVGVWYKSRRRAGAQEVA